MSHVVIDTHVLAWSFIAPSFLTPEVRRILESGVTIHVPPPPPPCSLHEITLKVRKEKWDEMAPYASSLDSMCAAQGFRIAPYTGRMAMLAGSMDWDHVDPFDRMIAATAIEMMCTLISADQEFDGLEGFSGWKGRIWNPVPENIDPVDPQS